MIYRLRNRHFYTWSILAVILPLGFILALTAIPKEQFNRTFLYSRDADAQATFLASSEWVTISQLGTGQRMMVEVAMKQPLTVPGALLFLSKSETNGIIDAQLLGKIDSKNTYLFKLGQEVPLKGQYLLFFDPINKVIFHTVSL